MEMNAAKGATANIRDAAKIGSIIAENVHPGTASEFMKAPFKNTAKLAGAYVAGHPWTAAAGNVGKGLVQGLMAPESLFALPYQMAAYEQEKIRANPNAPGLEYNPYAQTVRGEYATQGQAGAANARRAVINAPFGNVTPEERAILEQDRQQKLRMMMQYEAAKKVLRQQ